MARRRSVREIQAAAALLRRLGGQPPCVPIPNVVDIARTATRLRVYERPLPLGIHGLLAHVEARRPVLVLNSRLAAVDRNHTAAHELGHWLLHSGRTNGIGTHSNRQLQEWEANKFADELLLPEELVRRVISERRCSIGAAALRLGVRGTYLSRRIRELKLVGQPFLRRGSPVRGFSDTM